MKNFIRICSFVFLLIALSVRGYADEHFPFLAEVSKKAVNIRAGANTNFEKIDKLNQGDEVIVLAKQYDWYKVQLPQSAKVYVRADYLKLLQNSSAQLIGDKVNIRAQANSNATSVGFLTNQAFVNVVTQVNGWWQIEPPPQAVGWVRADFLSIKSNTIPAKLNLKKSQPKEEVIAKPKLPSESFIEIKGKLKLVAMPTQDFKYEVIADNKVRYYVQSKKDIDRFKGAIVLVKGTVSTHISQQYDYPVLLVSSISLLL